MLAALPRILYARGLGRGRVRDVIATVAVATVVVGGAALIPGTSSTPPTSPPGIDVWVSPSGNDSTCARGNQSLPCRTWTQAYAIAQTGDEIELASGSYGGQSFGTGTKTVTYNVASGATVTTTGTLLFNNTENVTVNGPIDTSPAYDLNGAFYGLQTNGCANNLVFNDISGRTFDIDGSSDNITINGGSWGGYTVTPSGGDSVVAGWGTLQPDVCGDGGLVEHIVIDGVYFHDVLFTPQSTWGGAHPDCLESYGFTNDVIIRNSVFERCGNTFIGWYTDFGNNTGIVVENNLFYKTTVSTFYGIQIGRRDSFTCDLVFRYNTFDPDEPGASNPHAPPLLTCPTQQVYGNIIRMGVPGSPICGFGTWSYNVFEDGGACGTNSFTGAAGFVSRGTDYHLADGAAAIGRGDPARFPSTDFEGTVRSNPPDAGYDERQ